jgi:hypothetical protein
MGQPSILYPNTPYIATVTATATDSYTGTAATNVLSAREDTYWRPANTTGTKVLTIDLGETRTLDTLALVGEGTDGVTVKVELSTDNSNWSTKLNNVTWSAPVNVGWDDWTGASARYIKISFSTFGSAFRVAWVCLSDKVAFPYLESDWDGSNVDEAGESLVSPGGLYLGNIQKRAMRELRVNFGVVANSEISVIAAFVEQCVKTGRPWVFVPDVANATSYFCWQQKPKHSAPFRLGQYEVAPISAITRAV